MAFKDSVKEYFLETGTLNKKRIKKIVLAVPFWVILAAVILIAAGFIRISVLTSARQEQYMATYWGQGADVDYRQMSVFARGARPVDDMTPLLYVSSDISLRKADIPVIRAAIQGTVDASNPNLPEKAKGLDTDGSPKGWEDAFSSTVMANVSLVPEEPGTNSDAIIPNTDAEIVGVGGNYKAFHPFRFLCGGFLPEEQIDRNQIVINDIMAWYFFKSYDVSGRKLTLGGEDFTVIGVVEELDTSIDDLAGADKPRAYIYFDRLMLLVPENAGSAADTASYDAMTADAAPSTSTSDVLAIQCYEAMMPELVNGVAITDIKNALPTYALTDPKIFVVSNTDRFTFLSVWDWVFPLGETQSQLTGYELPYWERAAQITVTRVFYDMVMIFVGAVLLIIGSVMVFLRFRKPKPAQAEEATAEKTEEEIKLLEEQTK
ncbi:MAG: ABC transporter permease [Clostridiales bacterium]|nr:ABC transporter permease [Clostridiales bacterium]